ncbi:MAG: DUF6285 domain-containing protein [Dehalococcoidia bacterium]
MQDRPTYDELLAAVERFLDEEIVQNTQGSRGFHARVAANVLRIVRRELSNEDQQLAREWAGLDDLLGAQERPNARAALREALASRNAELCERIRNDDSALDQSNVVAHVRRTVRDKLLVSNPAWVGNA